MSIPQKALQTFSDALDKPTRTQAMTKAKISCTCGSVSLELEESEQLASLRCGCIDCKNTQAKLQEKGGQAVKDLLRAVYFKVNKFSITDNKKGEAAKALKKNNSSETTRIVCTECHSILACHHPMYRKGVFSVPVDYVQLNFPVTIQPQCYVGLIDFNGDPTLVDPSMPAFNSFREPQDVMRFLALERFKDVIATEKGSTASLIKTAIDKLPTVYLETYPKSFSPKSI